MTHVLDYFVYIFTYIYSCCSYSCSNMYSKSCFCIEQSNETTHNKHDSNLNIDEIIKNIQATGII